MITTKRIYESARSQDGYRVLVDRLWPRGIRKADARIDDWWREYAPTTALRLWFGHDTQRWEAFSARYSMELNEHHAALSERLDKIAIAPITLVYAARDDSHNNAIVLRNYIRTRIFK